jgi:hypothetical protein
MANPWGKFTTINCLINILIRCKPNCFSRPILCRSRSQTISWGHHHMKNFLAIFHLLTQLILVYSQHLHKHNWENNQWWVSQMFLSLETMHHIPAHQHVNQEDNPSSYVHIVTAHSTHHKHMVGTCAPTTLLRTRFYVTRDVDKLPYNGIAIFSWHLNGVGQHITCSRREDWIRLF